MSNINEQEMRSYLLGGLPLVRRAELEALAQADENLREELLAVEEELVEQYLAGVLTDDETRSFAAHILTTERGQQKLHFARLFQRYRNNGPAEEPLAVHSVPAPNDPPIRRSSPLFLKFYRNPTFAVLALFVTGLVIMLVGWMLVGPSAGTSIAEETAREVIVQLAPDSSRLVGGIKHVPTQSKNGHVKLELELSASDFKKYKIKLFREDQAIDTRDELQTQLRDDTHYFIPVVVTADILTPGHYQLKLCGVQDSGQPASIDNYSFRVTDSDAPQHDSLSR